MLVSVPVHAAHTSAEAVGALSLGAPADGLAPSEAGKLCLLAQLVTEAFHRLQGCEYRYFAAVVSALFPIANVSCG